MNLAQWKFKQILSTCTSSQMWMNTLQFKSATPFTMEANGNAFSFSTVMQQLVEEFFWLIPSMIHGPFQTFWKSLVSRLENQVRHFRAVLQTNTNKFSCIELNTRVSLDSFCNFPKITFGQSDVPITCMLAWMTFMMSMLKECLQTLGIKSETLWRNLCLKGWELLILMLSHGQRTIHVHIDFFAFILCRLFKN